jgi:glucan 1,3-beta-glucosidase
VQSRGTAVSLSPVNYCNNSPVPGVVPYLHSAPSLFHRCLNPSNISTPSFPLEFDRRRPKYPRTAIMRFSTAVSVVAAAAPLAVSAGGTLGFCLGNVNADGSCKQQSDFEADLNAIGGSSQSKLVRTYSSTDQYGNNCNTPSAVMPAAQSAGFQVLLGMWPDGGAYEAEKASITAANVGQYGDTLYGITVGSEGIYRGSYTTTDLVGWISDMSSSFPGVTIGTADSWEGWANGTMDPVISSGIKLV